MAAKTRAGRPQHTEQTGRNQAYVYGNAVRRLEPVYQTPVRPERTPNTRVSNRVRRNQEKALQMDLPYVIALMIAACFMLYICVNYLHVQSALTARMDNIQQLEQELETKRSANDALETRIHTYVDLDHIYKVATEELGMVYANKDQVLLYDRTESEYVRQYEDIPTR